jgi:prepilin-type N-terminal cleavage/methylation domain-containing protein/prepilin-type processing-associated H-X9-DG protein
MNAHLNQTSRRTRALTLIEVLVVIAVVAVLVSLLFPALAKSNAKANRIQCVSYLKGVGVAFRIFSMDSTNRFPFQLSTNFGGSKEYANDASQLWRQFSVISNELSTPIIVHCPADRERTEARDFSNFTSNQQLSYFVGLNASEENPQIILSGDRNLILDGKSLGGQIITLSSNANIAFDKRIHRESGNIAMGDGSVQQMSSGRLREAILNAALAGSTNTLVVP